MESLIGKTKHADNCPIFVPAFIKVGELGRKSRAFIILKNSFSNLLFPLETAFATLLNILEDVSPFSKYLFFNISIAILSIFIILDILIKKETRKSCNCERVRELTRNYHFRCLFFNISNANLSIKSIYYYYYLKTLLF